MTERGRPGIARRQREHPQQHRWPKRLAVLLGRISDRQVAKRAGVSLTCVVRARLRAGIPPAHPRRPPVKWTPEMLSVLGTDIDREVAAMLGVSKQTVRRKRTILGIPAYDRARSHQPASQWPRRAVALLGTDTDARVARRLGVSPWAVCYQRQKRGIPAFIPPARPIRWTSRMVRLLGKVPDVTIATQLGVTIGAVAHRRRALRIAATRPCRRWTPREIALLGTAPDEVIARRLGRTPRAVRNRREALQDRSRSRVPS